MDVKFLGNTRAESRAPMRRVGRRLGAEVGSLTLKANKLEGFAKPVFDQRR